MTGRRADDFRAAVLARDRRCAWCGSDRMLVADHIVPLAAGGADHPANGQALCTDDGRLGGCHARKTADEGADIARDWAQRDAWAALVDGARPA